MKMMRLAVLAAVVAAALAFAPAASAYRVGRAGLEPATNGL
jgi:hypothetical protein